MIDKNWCVWCGTYLGSGWPIGKDGLPDRWASLTCPHCGRKTGFDSGRSIPPNVGIGVPLRCPRCQYVHKLNLVGNIYGLNPPLPCPQCGFDLRVPYDPKKQPNTQPIKTSIPPLQQNINNPQHSPSDFGNIARTLQSTQLATDTQTEVADRVPETSHAPIMPAQKKTSDPDIILGNWRGIHDGRKAADDNSIIAFVNREGGEYQYLGVLKQVGNVLKHARFSILEEMCWFNPTHEEGIYEGFLKRRKLVTGDIQVNPLIIKMVTPDRIELIDKIGTIYSTREFGALPQPKANANVQAAPISKLAIKDVQTPISKPEDPQQTLYPIPKFSRQKFNDGMIVKAFGLVIGILLLTISIILGVMLSNVLFNSLFFGLLPTLNAMPAFPLLFLQASPIGLLVLFTTCYINPLIWKKLTWQFNPKRRGNWVLVPLKIIFYLWVFVVIGLIFLVYIGYDISELLSSVMAWMSRGAAN